MMATATEDGLGLVQRLLKLALSDDPGESARFDRECKAMLPRVIGFMEDNPTNHLLLEPCVSLLKEYCYQNVATAQFLAHTNTMDLVLDAVQRHIGCKGLVLQGCGYFVNASLVEDNRASFASKGGIPTVLAVITRHKQENEVVKMGCMVLRNVSCYNAENQREIAAVGGISVLLSAAANAITDADLLEQCIAALLHLSHNRDTLPRLVQDGAVEVLSHVITIQSALTIVEEACAILVNISLHREGRMLLAGEGGIDSVLTCLRDADPNTLVAHRCVQVVGNLACTDELREEVVSRGALRAFLDILATPDIEPKTVRLALWGVLNCITSNGPAQRFLAFETTGVELIAQCMNAHPRDVGITAQGCKILWNLSYYSNEIQLTIAKDCMALLLNALQMHSSRPDLAQYLCSLLINLSLNENTHTYFYEEDCVSTIVDLMSALHDQPAIVSRCCRILINLAIDVERQRDMVQRGVPAAILQRLEGNFLDVDVAMKSCKLLATLSATDGGVQELLGDQNAPRVLVQAALSYMDKPDMLKFFLSVLLNISMAEATHSTIIEEGGVGLVVRCMRAHAHIIEVQSRCCRILGNILSAAHVRAEAEATQGISTNMQSVDVLSEEDVGAVVQIMGAHGTDIDVQVVCCWILDELTNKESKLAAVQQVGGLEAVLTTLSLHRTNPRVVKHALEVLVNYSSSLSLSNRYLIPEHATELVITALEEMPHEVQESCCIVLGNLADRDRDRLIDRGVVRTIINALNENTKNDQLQVEGLGCLCKLAAACGDWSTLHKIGGLKALMRLQHNNPTNTAIQVSCARAFRSMASLRASAGTLIEEGGITALLECFSSSMDPMVKDHALLALALVSHHAGESALMLNDTARTLVQLASHLLLNATDGKLLASACLLIGNLASRRSLSSLLHRHNVWQTMLHCLERCSVSSGNTQLPIHDYNALRLMCGYALCATILNDETMRAEVVPVREITDLIWSAVQDLQQATDVQHEFSLTHAHLEICQRALDIVCGAHVAGVAPGNPGTPGKFSWRPRSAQQRMAEARLLTTQQREEHRAEEEHQYALQQHRLEEQRWHSRKLSFQPGLGGDPLQSWALVGGQDEGWGGGHNDTLPPTNLTPMALDFGNEPTTQHAPMLAPKSNVAAHASNVYESFFGHGASAAFGASANVSLAHANRQPHNAQTDIEWFNTKPQHQSTAQTTQPMAQSTQSYYTQTPSHHQPSPSLMRDAKDQFQAATVRDAQINGAVTREQQRRREGNPDGLRAQRQERAMWEEQEEWERGQIKEAEEGARRRVEIRIAAFLKAWQGRKDIGKQYTSQASFSLGPSFIAAEDTAAAPYYPGVGHGNAMSSFRSPAGLQRGKGSAAGSLHAQLDMSSPHVGAALAFDSFRSVGVHSQLPRSIR